MSKDQIRNILNILFMIGAAVGMYFYLSKNEEKLFKITESALRMIK